METLNKLQSSKPSSPSRTSSRAPSRGDSASFDGAADAAPAAVDGEDASPTEESQQEVLAVSPAAEQLQELLKLRVVRVVSDKLPDGISGSREVLYVVRTNAEPIPNVAPEDIEVAMSSLEVGVMWGSSLSVLEQLITEIYAPCIQLFFANSSKPTTSQQQSQQQLVQLSDAVQAEFLANIQKFSAQIQNVFQQVSREVRLEVISIDTNRRVAEIASDATTVAQLQLALENWIPAIASIIEQEKGKKAVGKGPLAEVDFWRQRATAFGTVYEQLSTAPVRKMMEVMEICFELQYGQFKHYFAELSKLYTEAKDNVKFLTTLERHFKTISHGTLSAIVEALPSMMNALRMVWVISRHYNTDERMVPLMERIAEEIGDRVATSISIRSIFRQEPKDVIRKANEAKNVLDKWRETYYKVFVVLSLMALICR